jgi:hypothetical protein
VRLRQADVILEQAGTTYEASKVDCAVLAGCRADILAGWGKASTAGYHRMMQDGGQTDSHTKPASSPYRLPNS